MKPCRRLFLLLVLLPIFGFLPLAKSGELATTAAVPGAFPEIVPFAPSAPAGIVMVPDTSSTAAGLLLTSDTTSPPAGAGLEMVTGSVDEPPSGTVNEDGTDSTLFVTEMSSVPSA